MIIDPHAHMISRTTDDYEAMARAGVVAVIEPAFWLGQPRTSADTYRRLSLADHRLRALPRRPVRHPPLLHVGLNPKEANNEALAEAVMEILPRFAVKEGVVAMGELGYDEQTALEDRYLRAQIELAKEYELPIMIHTPHRDKKRGTLRTMDVLAEHGFDPGRCVIDHNNEETVEEVLDARLLGRVLDLSRDQDGQRAHDRDRAPLRPRAPDRRLRPATGASRIPLAVPKTARLMAERGIDPAAIRAVTYANALAVYGLNGEMREEHWTDPAPIDQRTLYQGNSVLRGGQTPVIREPGAPAGELRIA